MPWGPSARESLVEERERRRDRRKTKGKLAASALCLVAAVGLMAACAPQGSESTQGADKPAPITADDLGRIGNDNGQSLIHISEPTSP